MPGDQIDRSSLAEDAVGQFGHDLPTVRREEVADRADQLGMTRIDEPIDGSTSPADLPLDAGLETTEDASHRANLDGVDVTSFEKGDLLLAQSYPGAQLLLGQARPASERPKESASADVVHRPIVDAGASAPLHRSSTASYHRGW